MITREQLMMQWHARLIKACDEYVGNHTTLNAAGLVDDVVEIAREIISVARPSHPYAIELRAIADGKTFERYDRSLDKWVDMSASDVLTDLAKPNGQQCQLRIKP